MLIIYFNHFNGIHFVKYNILSVAVSPVFLFYKCGAKERRSLVKMILLLLFSVG